MHRRLSVENVLLFFQDRVSFTLFLRLVLLRELQQHQPLEDTVRQKTTHCVVDFGWETSAVSAVSGGVRRQP